MAPVSGRPPELTEFRHLCFHSHRYFIVPLRDTRLLTSKELRYNLLTFTIFIIQSQVGAIPVFSRLFDVVFDARVTTAPGYIRFDQGHVTKHQPIIVLVLLIESLCA